MAEAAVKDGIHTIVATPHSQNGNYLNYQETIWSCVADFRALLQSRKIPLDVYPGAEIRIHRDMDCFIKEDKIASLNNSGRYLLVEFPHEMVLPGTREVLFQLYANGITPVLAHPERNVALQRNPDILSELVAMGCLVQITAMSITGELGQNAMAYSHYLLKKRQAHVIASDAHDAVYRPPVLMPAVNATAHLLGDAAMAVAMVTDIPKAILEGKPVRIPRSKPENKKPSRLKKWFGRKKV